MVRGSVRLGPIYFDIIENLSRLRYSRMHYGIILWEYD